jgi:hypothetical protein
VDFPEIPWFPPPIKPIAKISYLEYVLLHIYATPRGKISKT